MTDLSFPDRLPHELDRRCRQYKLETPPHVSRLWRNREREQEPLFNASKASGE